MAAAAGIRFPELPDNVHLRGLTALFGDLAVPAAAIPPHAAIVFLCYTNRCGSNFLADALHSTGRFNLADEMLSCDEVARDVRRHGHASFADFLAAHMRWRMVGGRFAVKVATMHLEVLGRAGVLDDCRDTARYVFIERADRLGQAISAEIAWQTGQWTTRTTVEVPIDRLSFSRERIARLIAGFTEDNRVFHRFFADNAIPPVHVLYERLAADPAGEVRRIGAALGLPDLAYDPARITVQRQAGALNARWRAMFLGA